VVRREKERENGELIGAKRHFLTGSQSRANNRNEKGDWGGQSVIRVATRSRGEGRIKLHMNAGTDRDAKRFGKGQTLLLFFTRRRTWPAKGWEKRQLLEEANVRNWSKGQRLGENKDSHRGKERDVLANLEKNPNVSSTQAKTVCQ